MNNNFKEAKRYISAKKRVQKIKSFYFQIVFSIIIIPVIVLINLKLIEPDFHWFWFGVFGILFSLFLGWLDNYGYKKLGFGEDWKRKKINEIINNTKHNKN